jgi:hypothetical protein
LALAEAALRSVADRRAVPVAEVLDEAPRDAAVTK